MGTTQQGTRRFDLLGQVVSRGSVETPAGKFADCLKVLLTYTKTTGTIQLKDIRPSDRIIAKGKLNDRRDALVASEITVQDVIPGAQPGG